jgi:large subunit ribosomal protein L14
MKNHGTFFTPADNSGAKKVFCINQPTKKLKIGQTITLSVKQALPSHKSRVKKGDIHKGLVCEIKQKKTRFSHLARSFGENAVVLVNAKGDPIGTRVHSLASFELRAAGHAKVASISPFLF